MSRWLFLLVAAVLVNDVISSGLAPSLKLSNGKDMPVLGLGTWLGFSRTVGQAIKNKITAGVVKREELFVTTKGSRIEAKGDEVMKAVEWAIDAGYRHIDTAAIYDTETQVGQAIKNKITAGVVKREELFVTTKLWNDKHMKADVVPALRHSLQQLQLEYVDLHLIHWPIPLHANGSISDTDYLETWEGMVEAQKLGLTRSIGVSNFNQDQLARLINNSHVTPQVLQVEINLNLQQPSLLAYCKSQNITVTGYTPFGSLFYSKAEKDAPLPRVDTPELVAIANKYNKTVPQVNLRYLLELGVIPIPKSVTKSRVEQNIDVFDFHLTEDERTLMKGYDKNYRTIPVKHFIQSKYYPFEKN